MSAANSDDAAVARRAMALLDLTELGETAGEPEIRALCARAKGGGASPPVAALCVWPRHVAPAKAGIAGTGIRVATVVNFPAGTDAPAAVLAETGAALAAGADEIDLVLPWRAFLAGETETAEAMVRAVRAALPAGILLKVILESGEYPDAASIRRAALLAIRAGAHFVKTSTGKTGTGATPEAARAMLEAILASPRAVGLKPSGGIRTLADARAYLTLADTTMGPGWATPDTFRFGASGLHAALAAAIGGSAAPVATERY
jgi:deoxyribose-phosphate aldolase